jgi:hypothetical protein
MSGGKGQQRNHWGRQLPAGMAGRGGRVSSGDGYQQRDLHGNIIEIWQTTGATRFILKRRTTSKLCFKTLTDSQCTQAILRMNPFGHVSTGFRRILLAWLNWAYDGINSLLKIIYGNTSTVGLNP